LSSELGDLASQLQYTDDEEKVKRRQCTRHLVREFCHDALERWLSEMGIGWVLDLTADDPSAGTILLRAQPQRNSLTEGWIRALIEVMESTHLEYLQCLRLVLEEGFRGRLLRIFVATVLKERFVRGTDLPGRVQLFRNFEATVLRMLPFVDALLAAADLDASNGTTAVGVTNGEQAPSEKLQALLDVRDALSSASEGIQYCFHYCDSSVEMEAKGSKLPSLLSEKEHRLEEAIWNTMEVVRYSILSSDNDDDNEGGGTQISQGSPDIRKVTRSIVTYIKYLCKNYRRLNCIVRAAAELGIYVPNRDIISSFLISAEQDKASPLTTLALEMVSSLQVKLAKRSESFPDHSLRLLFLINNTHFIQQQLHPLFCIRHHIAVLTPKIEGYIQEYLQASWAPVMSCMYNHTPRWFRKNSALPKFDLEFEKTYTAQKLWKVPDPELKTRLRKAIVEQVIPGLTRCLEDNNVTSPGITPQEREEMLLELFEG
jgi:hypothetical protein